MAGAIAAGLHEGSRSEYLAQYVFSMFGTSVPVLHQEDHGIDLFCSLTERKGQRAWPVAYYSVQVKSTADPWLFEGADSVQWLLRYPAPLLLCVVDKSSARLRLYQLTARFQAAVLTDLPARLALVPGQPGDGFWTTSDSRCSARSCVSGSSMTWTTYAASRWVPGPHRAPAGTRRTRYRPGQQAPSP